MSWPEVAETRLIRTVTFFRCRELLEQTAERRGLGLFYGHPGVGKSRTLRYHARRLGMGVLEAQPEQRLSGLLAAMYALTGVAPPPGRLPRQRDEFVAGLRDPIVIVIDQADGLSLGLCRFLAELVGEANTKLAVVLVGTSKFEHRLRQAQTVRAVTRTWIPASALSLDDVIAALPHYHPIWSDADPLTLTRINGSFARGFFGRWAQATEQALELRPQMSAVPWSQALTYELLKRVKGRV